MIFGALTGLGSVRYVLLLFPENRRRAEPEKFAADWIGILWAADVNATGQLHKIR